MILLLYYNIIIYYIYILLFLSRSVICGVVRPAVAVLLCLYLICFVVLIYIIHIHIIFICETKLSSSSCLFVVFLFIQIDR
jgi:hypothetical protein